MANNRELSQFASYVEVNDTSRHISVASTSGQYVGIGSTQPTVKLDVVGDVQVSGAFTAPYGSVGNLNGTNLYYTGLSTVGNFIITPAGVGATVGNAGIVTYYGDGQYLDLSSNTSGGIGIQTGDTLIGYGATFIEFRGPGVSTGFYDSSVGIATIYFQGGGGGGGGAIGIGSTFPGTPLSVDPVPSNGDLFFHIDYGRTFIYYDEVILGVGSSAFWIDSAPFNIGIITALSGGVAFDDGTAITPSWYFIDDQKTGVFSPVNGELTFVSTGSSVLNINSDGIIVTGVTTSTKANIGAATTFPEDLVVQGDARVTGILTVGTSSIILDGGTDTITVGSGATINGSNGNAVFSGTVTAPSFAGNLTGDLSGDGSSITNLNADNLSSGTVPDARFPATLPTASGANLTSLNASNLGSGTVPDARFPATLPSASGANLTSLNASNLSSGTVATARLASGTANSGTYLRGDQTWAAVSSGLTITNDTSTNSTFYPTFTSATSGSISGETVSSSKLTFNPSTGKLTVTGFTASSNVVLPVGNAATRDSTQGSIRYNTEYNVLELYNGTEWIPVVTTGFTADPADTALFVGGYKQGTVETTDMYHFNISSTGNGATFGTLDRSFTAGGSVSSTTRGVFAGGYRPSPRTNAISYTNFAIVGSTALTFGTLADGRAAIGGCGSPTRGVFGGGEDPLGQLNIIEYITIAALGNAQDFGDLSFKRYAPAGCSSPTRGIFAGGRNPTQPAPNVVIDYITIASTGNATSFGNLFQAREWPGDGGCSSSTRGVFGGGAVPTAVNTIDYITIASTGNANDFGDLINVNRWLSATSNATRGVFAGGYTPPVVNVIQYVTIASTGNATDFGDLPAGRWKGGMVSSAHGGLQ